MGYECTLHSNQPGNLEIIWGQVLWLIRHLGYEDDNCILIPSSRTGATHRPHTCLGSTQNRVLFRAILALYSASAMGASAKSSPSGSQVASPAE